ncbi:MAG TPA: universal stress protein [Chitinophagaceae bacterium]|nr:universal stress protein [Chitinophagaceae bacterium]
MKTIIAPVDFSSVSTNACEFAAKMAAYIHARLILMHVQELPAAVAEYPVSEEVFNSMNEEEDLDNLRLKLLAETGNSIEIDTKYVLGSADYEIRQLCNDVKPLAVVMGTHSYGALDRFLIGSKTLYAAKNLKYPVLIVPPGAEFKPFKKIALASDLKDVYQVPVHEIEVMIKYFNAGLDIFYAGKNEEDLSRRTLGDMLLEGRLEYMKPQFYFTEDTDVMRGVSALAKKHNTDLLVVVPKKHGLFHKSQSKDFILYSNVPVLAIHEDDMSTPE